MTDTIDTTATPVDPLLEKSVTLTFTIRDINGILSTLGTIPYAQSAGIIGAIHAQCGPQVAEFNKEIEAAAAAPAAE